MVGPRVVIIGAGVVGAALADELSVRGLDRRDRRRPGPPARHGRVYVPRPGPGVPDELLQDDDRLARYTVEKLGCPRRRRAACFSRSAAWRSPPPRSASPNCTAGTAGRPPGASTPG